MYINDIGKKLKSINVNFALFADDISIWFSSKNLKTIEKKLQKATDILPKYSNKWSMKINTTKTNYILFHKKYITNFNQHNNLNINLNYNRIEKATYPKLLGITLDEHLNFNEHFRLLHNSINAKFNMIKILSSKIYNINPSHLITIYKSFILSKIQYSMLPYLVTNKKNRQQLQITQTKS